MIIKFAIRRFFEAVPTLFILITLSFFLMRLAPGNPFSTDKNYPPEVIANIKAKYNFDKPMFVQFLIFLKDIAHFDFGPSFKYKDFTVNELVSSGFRASYKLGWVVFVFSATLGILFGVFTALKQNSFWDYGLMFIAIVGVIIPNFVVVPFLVLIFAVKLGWLPSGGWNDGAFAYMVIPVISLVFGGFAGLTRVMRGSMIETLHSNFIKTAYAKGLPMSRIVIVHTLRGALLPVITILGPMFVGLITGTIIVETTLGIPGLGQLYLNGALNRDYGLVMSLTILVGSLIILFNAIVDILYALLDPRISY